jgi:hypothetical protein
MNLKKYQEALADLERLHWHLHLNGGPDLWTRDLLWQFEAAVHDNGDEEEIVILTAEPPQPAA